MLLVQLLLLLAERHLLVLLPLLALLLLREDLLLHLAGLLHGGSLAQARLLLLAVRRV